VNFHIDSNDSHRTARLKLIYLFPLALILVVPLTLISSWETFCKVIADGWDIARRGNPYLHPDPEVTENTDV
jgi:hypothetical protein